MRVLITGMSSFIGSWLTQHLVSAGAEVLGASSGGEADEGGVSCRRVDVRDAEGLAAVVRELQPDRVFHLAAQSNIKQSFELPAETLAINIGGSVNLFEAVRKHAPQARVVSVGSSAEYGKVAGCVEHLAEESPLAPTSPYGVSKAAQGQLVAVYAKARGLDVVHVRPFAVIGPRKRGDAVGDFCAGVAQIELGRATQLSVGNTSSVRDFIDVRDCVAALDLVADKGKMGEVYNVCNGRAASLDDVIAKLREVSATPFEVVADPRRTRPVDDARIVGDPRKLRALGFAARHSLRETIEATLDHWRAQIRRPT